MDTGRRSRSAALDEVLERQGPLDTRGSGVRTEIAFPTCRRVQTGKHSHRESSKIKIFTTPNGDDLLVRYPVIPGDVGDALVADNDCLSGARNIRRIQHVNVMGMREKDVIRTIYVAICRGCVWHG